VAEELLLSVPGDLGACCEELLDLLAGTLVGVHGEEERGDLLLCVCHDVADVECLVCLDVAVGGVVAAGDVSDVLTCLVRLVLDVALNLVLVDVVGEPRVVADDGGGLCEGESDDGLELHLLCFAGWLCFVAGLGKYLSYKMKKVFQFFLRGNKLIKQPFMANQRHCATADSRTH